MPTPAEIAIIPPIEYIGGNISRVLGVSNVNPKIPTGIAAIHNKMTKMIVPDGITYICDTKKHACGFR